MQNIALMLVPILFVAISRSQNEHSQGLDGLAEGERKAFNLKPFIKISLCYFLIWLLSAPVWIVHVKGGTLAKEDVSVSEAYSAHAELKLKEDTVIGSRQSTLQVIYRLLTDNNRLEAERIKRISLID